MRTFTLVSCVGKKRENKVRAEHLYQSAWFRSAASYARQHSDGWAILSAKHGLLYPWEFVDPYELTLNTMPIRERRTWSNQVIYDLANTDWESFTILAGAKYREFIVPWMDDNNISYEIPMKGFGIGQQLKWLKENT